MSIPIISIIVPIYNTEKYLPRCLDSLIGQTFTNIEIICVIDGSEDNSLDICKNYKDKDPRIIIITQENQGLSGARNTGLIHSNGEYVQFCDSDDYYSLSMCEKLFTVISLSGADLAMTGIKVVDEQLNELTGDFAYYKVKREGMINVNAGIFQTANVFSWNKIFRKSIIDKYQIIFPVGLLFEDAAFFFKYLFVSKNIFYTKEILYTYVRHQNTIMSNTFNKSMRAIDHVKILIDIRSFIIDNELEGKYVNNIFLWIIIAYTYGVIMYGPEAIYESAFTITASLLTDVSIIDIKKCPYLNKKQKLELLALKDYNTQLFLKLYFSRPHFLRRLIKRFYLFFSPKVLDYVL